jgi:hypothetical protein
MPRASLAGQYLCKTTPTLDGILCEGGDRGFASDILRLQRKAHAGAEWLVRRHMACQELQHTFEGFALLKAVCQLA